MKKQKIRTGNVLKILLVLFLVLIALLKFEIIGQPMLNMSFRYSDKKLISLFKNEDLKPVIKYHEFENHSLRYLELITNPHLPYVVFIHGAPGSSADYLEYFRDEELYSKVNIISVDRLGYGYSNFGNAQISIHKQAEAIQSIINKTHKSDDIILVGHSYGGPIVIKMAMEYPNAYKSLLLLAPALDPSHEKEFKIGQLAMINPTRWLTPPALRVAADEKFSHVDELNKMVTLYNQIKVPVVHAHGTKDSLVPYENLAFSERKIDTDLFNPISLDDADHFLPWSHHDLIVDTIIQMARVE